jgi:hypothetical protein
MFLVNSYVKLFTDEKFRKKVPVDIDAAFYQL